MVKAIGLMSRLPSVTRQEFETYFENNHAPLILSLLPGVKSYRRNYVRSKGVGGAGVGEEAPFDALVELRFEDDDALDRFIAAARTPDIQRRIQADKANFLDAAKSKLFKVREDILDIPREPGELAPQVKLALFLCRRPHVTPEQFADYYDKKHAPLLSSLLPWIRVYNRNHVLGGAINAPTDGEEPPFNTFTELRLKDAAAVQEFRAEFAKPEIMRQIRADEANFLQGEKSRLFEVEEYDSVIP